MNVIAEQPHDDGPGDHESPVLQFEAEKFRSNGERACHGFESKRHGSARERDRKSTRLNSSHGYISYAVFCLKKKNTSSRLDPLRAAARPRRLPARSPCATPTHRFGR